MAEIAVSIVLDKLIPLFDAKVEQLSDLHKEVEDIKVELEFIASFLKEADARASKADDHSNSGLKTWVKHVREAAFLIEDVIDEYLLHFVDHHDYDQQIGCGAFFQRIALLVKNLKKRHEIASSIQDVKRFVHSIGQKSERYGFNIADRGETSRGGAERDDSNRRRDPRVGIHFVENDSLVGIDSPKNELISVLEQRVSTRMVISLVGMGGIGKTTLAKKVFDDQTILGHYDCHAWVTVSQSYTSKELLKKMIKQFYERRKEPLPEGIEAMDESMLISHSREFLRGKRYLLVFDDVWRESFWLDVEYALLDNHKGSRIMITTRNVQIAEFCKKSSVVHLHELKSLSPILAQQLLCKIAFQFEQKKQDFPLELEPLTFDIVRRCEGLPLAIVAVGGLLSTKGKDASEWKRLCVSLNAQLDNNPHLTYIKQILSFSYLDLPYYLKSCFLYLCLFPEDHSINCARLFRLWAAEGSLERKQGMTQEEVGREYLIELIHRNLVQVARIDSTGKVRECRVHDLMREVILSKSEEISLIQTSPKYTTGAATNGIGRHLSVSNRANTCSTTSDRNFQTHSIIFFEVNDLPTSLFRSLSKNFKLLRELDFEGVPLNYISEELGNLLHLRYLSLRSTNVKKLPKSIAKLHNLQTLDLKWSLVDELPMDISKLHNLKYLAACYVNEGRDYSIHTRRGLKIHGSIGNLQCLEKLYTVDMEAQPAANFITELGRLKQLRKLGVINLKSDDGMALCFAIEQMAQLRSLRISSITEEQFLQLQSLSSPPPLLQSLRLHGRLTTLPDWIPKMKNLVRIGLQWTRISDDSFKLLGVLPKLSKLSLYKGYDGDELRLEEGQFTQLKYLGLFELNGLKRLVMDNGALPLLERFHIGSCPQLADVPFGMCYLKCLRTLEFWDMPIMFSRKMLPDEGADHWKVIHIPNVLFYYRSRGEMYDRYKLGDSRLSLVLL